MSFCQATSCFYFHDSDGGQEIIPSSGINQIIFEVPLSTVARTLWSFEDPDDPENKVYIAKFKPFGNFNEEPFQATLKGALYHLDKKNPQKISKPDLSHIKRQHFLLLVETKSVKVYLV